jgi:hypothetical protein
MNRPERHFRARLAVLMVGGALIAALFPMAGSVLAAAGPGTQMVFTTQPIGGVTYGANLSAQPVVEIRNASGVVVTSGGDETAAVTLTLLAPTVGGPGVLACGTNPLSAVAGVATFAGCKVNTNSGSGYKLRATATLNSVTVTADSAAFTINSADPTKVVFSTSPSSSTGGIAFPTQPVVQVQDAASQIAVQYGGTVALAIANNAGPGGILTCTGGNSKAVTNGSSTFAGCAIDKIGTGYTVSANAGGSSGLTADTSAAFNITLGAAAKLLFTQQPVGDVGVGIALTTQPKAAVTDAGGNVQTGDAASQITLAIKSGTPTVGGPGALACTTNPVTVVAGVATFAACKINNDTGAAYQLHATSGSLTAADSTAFNIVSGPGTKLAFSIQPGGGTGGTAWTVQPVVQVRDASSDVVVTDSTTVVTLAINTNPGTGTLTCTGGLSKTVTNGQATFAGCSIDKIGTGYTLIVTSSPYRTAATSTAFNVTLGAAVKLGFTSTPGASTINLPFTVQPVVAIQDAGGNTVAAAPATTVTLAIGTNPGAGTLTCTGGLTRTTSLGVASFSGCYINNAGTGYTLTASATGYTLATSSAFNVTAPAAVISLVRSTGMVTYGGSVGFSIQFAAGGASRTVYLEHTYVGSSWTTVATLTTNASGFASVSYAPTRTGYYRVRFAGAADLSAANSNVVLVGTRQTVTLFPTHTGVLTIDKGRTITFRSTVRPLRPDLVASRVTFRFYQKVSGSWVLKYERHVSVDVAGTARTAFRFGVSGSWYVTAFADRSPYNAVSRFSQREYFLVH